MTVLARSRSSRGTLITPLWVTRWRLGLARQRILGSRQRRRLNAPLIVAFALVVVAVGCTGSEEIKPTGQVVVFGSPDVSLIPVAGGKVRRLRIDDDEFWEVAFSADGSQVAFSPAPSSPGALGITVVTLKDGSTTVVLDQSPKDDFGTYGIAWAPDGGSLAFVAGDSIFTISIDGSDLRELARGMFPTWTPDGDNIVFVSGWDLNDDNGGNIRVIGVDGTGVRSLGRGLYPDVSPSGDEVAYSTAEGIFVRPFAGGAPRLVVADGFGPVWSLDGRFLAFTRHTDCSGGHGPCSGRIFIVPAKGGTPRAIGPTIGDLGGPEDWIR